MRWLALLVAGSCACSPGQLELGELDQPIVAAEPMSGDGAVLALVADGEVFCSGTLIYDRIVLTAAHCVPPNVPTALEDIRVVAGAEVAAAEVELSALASRSHPSWTSGQLGNDVGLLALSQSVGVESLAMLTQPLEELGIEGTEVRVAGFGATDFDGNGGGIRRSGWMQVDSVAEQAIELSPSPASTCNGDSGGPLLVAQGGQEFVAGIHSRSDCSETSLNERVDRHATGLVRDFIEEQGGSASCSRDGLCADGCDTVDFDCPSEARSVMVVGGCAAAGGGSQPWCLLLLLLVFRRRERTPFCPDSVQSTRR